MLPDMLGDGMRAHLEALSQAGTLEVLEGRPFAPLFSFDSGTRCGLCLGDDGAAWAVARDGVLVPFSPKAARVLVEALELPREQFEAVIDRNAAALGFEGEPVSFSFPTVELVRVVLATRSAFLCRRALNWLLPSELRPLREDIAAMAGDTSLPNELRHLARRLIVSG
jgi:hypothetical protein